MADLGDDHQLSTWLEANKDDVNEPDVKSSMTLLMYACKGGSPSTVTLLLVHGASYTLRTESGFSALHYCALLPDDAEGSDREAEERVRDGRLECAKLLVGAGASVDVWTSNNMSPIGFAVMDWNAKLVELLLLQLGGKQMVNTPHNQKVKVLIIIATRKPRKRHEIDLLLLLKRHINAV
jgi:ankyrin repeat protein